MNGEPIDKELRFSDAIAEMKFRGLRDSELELCYDYIIVCKNAMVEGIRQRYKEEVDKQDRKNKRNK